MKKYKLLILSTLYISPAIAMECVPQPLPCSSPSTWSIYGGAGAGLSYLKGKWNLQDRTLNFDRTTKKGLSDLTARAEAYLGARWNLPQSPLSLGLEPYFSYSNGKQHDFNPRLLGTITLPNGATSVNVSDSIAQTLQSKFSTGLNFRPSYHFEGGPHSIYGLVGASVTQVHYKFQDQAGPHLRTNKYAWGFNWGVGYEYRFGNCALGLRFRQDLLSPKKIYFSNGGSNFFAKLNPKLHSLMLTYSYYFK